MIKILNSPNTCALTKNSMVFEVESTQFFKTEKVLPKLILTFDTVFTSGRHFQFQFINPETLGAEIIRFRTVDEAKYEGDVDVPVGISVTLDSYTTQVVGWLQKIKKLSAFYTIEKIDPGNIEIIAREAIEELVPTDIDSNFTGSFIYSIKSTFYEPIERAGYQMKALLFYSDPQKNVDSFELINAQPIALDQNAKGLIDVSELLNGKIESDFDEVPVPSYTNSEHDWYYFAPNTRQYYLQFKETWTGAPMELQTESSVLYAFWGGISTDDEIKNDTISHLLTSNKFLTWIPSGKEINTGQVDWLHFMNGPQIKPWKIQVTVQTTIDITTYQLGEIEIDAFQCLSFNASIEKYFDNPDFETMTLAEGEKILNYTFKIFEQNLITTSYSSTPTDTYTYHFRDYCHKKYLLYFNSFNLPETFSTNSNWTETMNISSEIASRGLLYNSSNLRSKEFIFSSSHQNSIVFETSLLRREEAKRLQTMISSTYSFIWEENRWVPVIITTKKANFWMNSEFTMYLEIEMIKSNSSAKASFYPTLPRINIEKKDFDLLFHLQLNEYRLLSIGSLKIYDVGGVLKKTLTFDTGNQFYKLNSLASNWNTVMLDEGIYNYEVQVTNLLNETETLKGVFEVKFDRFQFLTGANDYVDFGFEKINTTGFGINSYIKYNMSNETADFSSADISPEHYISTTYSIVGYKQVTVMAPTLQDINRFVSISGNCKDFNFDLLVNLEELYLQDLAETGVLFLNKLHKLKNLTIIDSPITGIELGFMPDLVAISFLNLDVDALALETFIKEIWTFRKLYGTVTITLEDMVTPSIETTALIDGTGIYAGDGLVDNGFTVTII